MAIEYVCAAVPLTAMAAAGGVALVRIYFSNTRRMTSFVTGEVVRADQRASIVKDRRQTETSVVVKYTVSGEEYEITHKLDGERARQFPEGKPLPVRYNPADPKMAALAME